MSVLGKRAPSVLDDPDGLEEHVLNLIDFWSVGDEALRVRVNARWVARAILDIQRKRGEGRLPLYSERAMHVVTARLAPVGFR